ncbi:MAG: Crp/Fnr family transcriptional regulator [Spirochaetia bacterium]|nr:MAG: Crp/Fnr family transcriptional regulator [Spirochaetia bacterium]
MANALAAKLRNFARLSEADEAVLDELCVDVRSYRAKRDLIKEGDRPEAVFLLVEGWACRYKLLHDGKRQIMAYLVPGDLCDVHIFILKQMDHSIGLISDAKVAAIPKATILRMFAEHPNLAQALWWSTLTDEAVLREWIVNMGQRDAYERIAHLLVELWLRLKAVGQTTDGSFELPVTQTDLGDTLGLTPVHINRMLQRLRADGLIRVSRGRLLIPDIPKLMAVSRFEPNYLHLSAL